MTQQAIDQALELVKQGQTANQAAATLAPTYNRSPRTILRWCQQAGTPLGELSQDTAKDARHIKEEHFKERRAELRLRLMDAVDELLDRLYDPYEDYRGKDAALVKFERPPSEAVRNLAVAVGIIIDKMRLEEGAVTGRTEHLSLDAIDRQLRVMLDANT